jgi:hypothetical protein
MEKAYVIYKNKQKLDQLEQAIKLTTSYELGFIDVCRDGQDVVVFDPREDYCVSLTSLDEGVMLVNALSLTWSVRIDTNKGVTLRAH